ncbi:ABC transporter permease [Desulfovibrio sp. OttesenSCG-928-C14]|nr:ABC transporter permease [Desulfovibrio sp. OttesenSCG-928-C14]
MAENKNGGLPVPDSASSGASASSAPSAYGAPSASSTSSSASSATSSSTPGASSISSTAGARPGLGRDILFWAGLFVVLALALSAAFAPWLAPWDPDTEHLGHKFSPPSDLFPLGTDSLGRDVLSRLIFGSRISLMVGFVSVGIAIVIGSVLGLAAGYFRGWADELVMRFVDVMLCFPSFFLILAVVAFLDADIYNIMVIIGLTSWMGVARLVRAETLSLREREFVAASRLAGAGSARIIFLHILPNAMAPVLVSATLGVAGAILTESALSFLGIGVQAPTASWGNMLTEGRGAMGVAWWLSVFPGLAILLTVLGFNLLGEGIRELLDPSRGRAA